MDGSTFVVEFVRRRNSGLVYTPMLSTDLVSFSAMSGTITVSSINTGWERVVVRQAVDLRATPKLFARVEVALPCPHPLRPGPEPVRLDPGMQSGCYDLAGLRWIEAGTAGPWINLTAAPVQARVAGTALRLPAVDFLRVFSFGTDPQVILTGLTVPTGATALQVRLRYHPEIDMAADSFAKLAASGPMRG